MEICQLLLFTSHDLLRLLGRIANIQHANPVFLSQLASCGFLFGARAVSYAHYFKDLMNPIFLNKLFPDPWWDSVDFESDREYMKKIASLDSLCLDRRKLEDLHWDAVNCYVIPASFEGTMINAFKFTDSPLSRIEWSDLVFFHLLGDNRFKNLFLMSSESIFTLGLGSFSMSLLLFQNQTKPTIGSSAIESKVAVCPHEMKNLRERYKFLEVIPPSLA